MGSKRTEAEVKIAFNSAYTLEHRMEVDIVASFKADSTRVIIKQASHHVFTNY